jgi:hypothetical protein
LTFGRINPSGILQPQEAATRVKQENVGWLTENKIDRVETNAIYAIGTKRF